MNIIIDFSKYEGFWWAKKSGITGIKIGWFGLFITTYDVINLAAHWKKKAETIQKERDSVIQNNIELVKVIENLPKAD